VWVTAGALAAPLLAQNQPAGSLRSGPTGGAEFPAGGVRVEVPGHPECVLTVEAWESGSFLTAAGQPRPAFSLPMHGRWLKPGTRDTDEQAGRDEREIAHQLELALTYSPDMVDKVTRACALRGSLAIRLVRDDPSIPVGVAVMTSNLVMIDIGDAARTASQVTTEHAPGTPDLTRYEAPVQAGRAFMYGLLAHEIDHLQESGDGAHSDPGKGAAFDDQQGGAVRDENLVLDEMKLGFRRPTYVHFHDGRSVVLYEGQATTAVFDPSRATATPRTRANGAATEGHFVDEDMTTVDGIEDRCCACDGVFCPGPVTAPAPTTPTNRPLLPLFLYFEIAKNEGQQKADAFLRKFMPADNTLLTILAGARVADGPQLMGGSTLTVDERPIDLQHDEMPSSRWLSRLGGTLAALARSTSPARASLGHSPIHIAPGKQQPAGRHGRSSVIAVFTSLGRSSGKAFRMDVVHDSPEPLRALGDGFVLEPLARVTPQQVQRDLDQLKGRRASATIVAYCLEFTKTPPALDTIYRLVPPDAAKKYASLPAIMAASKRLLSDGRLHPDSAPEEYFHAVRQWTLWSEEQGWRTEEAFGNAFVSHAKKNLAAAGRPWTAQIEAALRKIVPGRWRDIEAVRAEARVRAAPSR
jgi:hypothetical protein